MISLSHWSIWIVMATAFTIQAKVVDLSHDHARDTIMSPDNPKYRTQRIFEGNLQPGVYAKFNSYSLGEHGGTHIDAPTHFHKAGHSLEKVPIENTIADGVMINCAKEVSKNPDYALTLKKVKEWEKANGKIPKGAAVVVNFGWSSRFKDINRYFNTKDLSDQDGYRFPVVSKAAIDWLLDERDIQILAIDGPSPDLLKSSFPVHVKMLKSNRLIVENLKDPGRLPAKGFRFHATPVKFVGATGVQVRAFAMVGEGNGSREKTGSCFVLVVAMGILTRFLF